MSTPFDLFKIKNKQRKTRIDEHLSLIRHSLSVQISSRGLSSSKEAESHKRSRNKRVQSVRNDRFKPKPNNAKSVQEENYQVLVTNAIKKSSDVRLTLSRSGQPLPDSRVSCSSKSRSRRNLQVEGTHCGRDLIKLNRRKLQEMISKIAGNDAQVGSNQAVPEIMVSKYVVNKYSWLGKDHKTSKLYPTAKTEQKDSHELSGKILNFCLQEEPGSLSFKNSSTEKFDIRDFLRCDKIRNQQGEGLKAESAYSLVLDNNRVVDFIRNSKMKKMAPRNANFISEHPQERWKTKVGYSNRDVLNFKAPKKKEVTSTASSPQKWMSHSQNSSPLKAKINGLNFKNLEGWQSPEDTIDLNLLTSSFIC